METEIVIEPSARGYRFELPEYCTPSPKLIAAFRAFKWLSYHEATPYHPSYRLFPAEQLEFMTGLLNHWYVEQSASALVGCNRNGGRIVAVRVAEAECGHDLQDIQSKAG